MSHSESPTLSHSESLTLSHSESPTLLHSESPTLVQGESPTLSQPLSTKIEQLAKGIRDEVENNERTWQAKQNAMIQELNEKVDEKLKEVEELKTMYEDKCAETTALDKKVLSLTTQVKKQGGTIRDLHEREAVHILRLEEETCSQKITINELRSEKRGLEEKLAKKEATPDQAVKITKLEQALEEANARALSSQEELQTIQCRTQKAVQDLFPSLPPLVNTQIAAVQNHGPPCVPNSSADSTIRERASDFSRWAQIRRAMGRLTGNQD